MEFESPDLRHDPRACWYLKDETVQVVFASDAGCISSREGPNHYRAADALITGSDADRWSVSRARFDQRYQPAPPLPHGSDGAYRSKPLPVLARQILEPFTARRCEAGDLLRGTPGDWLLQYAPRTGASSRTRGSGGCTAVVPIRADSTRPLAGSL